MPHRQATQGSTLGLEAVRGQAPPLQPEPRPSHDPFVWPRTCLLRTHFSLLRLDPPLFILSLGSWLLEGWRCPQVFAFSINTCINKFVL